MREVAIIGVGIHPFGRFPEVGFKEMGRWRKSRVVDGEAYDLVFLDILAEEFEGYAVRNLTRGVLRSQQANTSDSQAE